MHAYHRISVSVLGLAVVIGGAHAIAQDGVDPADISKWPTEKVVLKDGRQYDCLIRNEADEVVELVEVRRRPGQPMYWLVRWIAFDDIAEIHRLSDERRLELEQNISRFNDRLRITADLQNQIKLEQRDIGDHIHLYYHGPWFSFASTTEDALTRQAIVRLEQVFAGFRTFVPPRQQPPRPLRIVLLDTLDEYLDYQLRAGLRIKNWAYFDPRTNEIVAGGQLARFAEQLQAAERHHQQLLRRQAELKNTLREKLSRQMKELRAAGATDSEMHDLRQAAKRQLDELLDRQKREIGQAEVANDELFQQQFRFLYHEAFHAYLDNYVYDKTRHDVPRWLHEGLAQVFENGLLEAGSLRLDAPRPAALLALQKDLQSSDRLPLADVVAASAKQFLVRHDDAARASNRIYLYSWGLAHYLTFRMQLLDSKRLASYVAADPDLTDPVRRFEKLVGMPIDQFQHEWRAAMLEL